MTTEYIYLDLGSQWPNWLPYYADAQVVVFKFFVINPPFGHLSSLIPKQFRVTFSKPRSGGPFWGTNLKIGLRVAKYHVTINMLI